MNDADDDAALLAAVIATIQAERAAADLSLVTLSERSGVSLSVINRLVSSHPRDLRLSQVIRIAAVFDMTPEELLMEARRRMLRATGEAAAASVPGQRPSRPGGNGARG